ncbi:hypothetical protein A7U60_g1096 [Sanghuangporus baumii]|uniref:Uncharacterized protein n=1 Tax=Sanghuangporus baumii TaxID=108892 RepID=A0A9Q5N9I1_SANBA|nr:hypothetical protein A7U60_g1096 [Sanghuangporus baumii]
MQNSDEDLASIIARWTPARARFRRSITNTRGSDQAPARSLLQDSTEDSESNDVQVTSENTSPDLTDTFNRLQQIRSALSYLEESIVRADRIEGQVTATAPQISTSNVETGIGPTHSAIVLSEEDNPTPPFEGLRERLRQIERNLPEVMHATTDMIQILARTRQDASRTQDTRSSASPSDGSTSRSRQPESAAATSPRNRTSDAVSGRTGPLRPVREFNRSAESNDGLLRPETRTIQEVRPTHTLPAWRVAHRDDDSPSTLLGRRVASRAAVRSSGSSTSDQRRRAIPPSTVFWQSHWQGQNDPFVGIPHRAGMSRVVIPARVPERVSRRIAQFESAASERQRHEDSDGSETEVDHYVFRRPIVRRLLHDNGRSERIQRQMDPGRDGRPQNPLGFVTISPSSSVGRTVSTGPSSSEASPQQTEEERPPAVTSRMQNVYGHLNRLSSALSDAPSSLGPSSSSTDGGDLDGALFSRTAGRRREGDDLYHEVVDEEEGRSYRILRRLNADGDEQVHQLNSDPWTDDPFGPTALAALRGAVNGETEHQFLSAAQADATNTNGGTTNSTNSNAIPSSLDRLRRSFNIVRQSQQSETDLPPLITDSPSLNTNMATRRRRGWARLDANGDEIPTDEEEEIDRILTAQRVRTNQGVAWRSSTNASSSSSTVLRTRLEYLAPTTRSVFSHATDDDDDDENTSDIRVRLGIASALPSRRFVGPTPRFNVFSDAWKEKEKEREPEQEFFGTSEPYFVSPIPMLFEDRDLASSGASRSESYNTRKGLAELRERAVAGL